MNDHRRTSDSVALWAGSFGILSTALALTVFEAGFIFQVVLPQVKRSVYRAIDDVDVDHSLRSALEFVPPSVRPLVQHAWNQLQHDSSDTMRNARAGVIAAAKTIRTREAKLIRKANGACAVKMAMIIAFVLALTVYSWGKAAPLGSSSAPSDRAVAAVTSGGSVVVLIAFQVYFYFLTKRYHFAGVEGIEEVYSAILDPQDPISGVWKAPAWPCEPEA